MSRPYLDQHPEASSPLTRARRVGGAFVPLELPPGTVLFELDHVVAEVAAAFVVAAEQLTTRAGQRTPAHLFEARCAACWLVRRHSRMTVQRLSIALGFGDHTAAAKGYRRAEELRERDEWFRDVTDRIERLLEQRNGEAA